MVNRGRIEIMADILGLCTKPQVKTRIMYHVNITFRQFETYATLLKSQDLLAHEANRYVATEKGIQFINAFSQLQNAMEDRSRNYLPIIYSVSAKNLKNKMKYGQEGIKQQSIENL